MSKIFWKPTSDGWREGDNGTQDSPAVSEVTEQHPLPTQAVWKEDHETEFGPTDSNHPLPVRLYGGVVIGEKTVHCPGVPQPVPGIASADALDALDTVGSLFTIRVPKSGKIQGARLYDPGDQGSALNVHLFTRSVVLTASDAAWSLVDGDSLFEIATLACSTFVDNINNQYSQLRDQAISYSAPEGLLYVGLATPAASTPTYTVPAWPHLQLVIISDDPDFVEGE